jgi:hypothetical protein
MQLTNNHNLMEIQIIICNLNMKVKCNQNQTNSIQCNWQIIINYNLMQIYFIVIYKHDIYNVHVAM